jgi:SAM-dependent methyltransferase
MERRYRAESPNILIEKPATLALLGDVSEKRILDLGCGDASLALDLIEKGCASYKGIEGSVNMYEKALGNLKNIGTIEFSKLEEYKFPNSTYDIVVSQLVLHYIEDFQKLSKLVYTTLRRGGKFVFSVQHPLTTAFMEQQHGKGQRSSWIVDDYFYSGKRSEAWIGENVVKYHRTIEEYFMMLQQAGFVIEALREPKPKEEDFTNPEEYIRRMRIPLFLILSATKK